MATFFSVCLIDAIKRWKAEERKRTKLISKVKFLKNNRLLEKENLETFNFLTLQYVDAVTEKLVNKR